MKKNISKILLNILFIILVSCGFKVVKNNNMNNFMIKEFKSSGDGRINYKIKNNLLMSSSNESTNIILLKLISEKKKTIKEKNIKNQITKYQITLISKINLQSISNIKKIKFNITESGEFLVGNTNLETINNEKRIIDHLTEELSEKIIKRINLEINDS
tara:strand:- start:60 stop:536 length:477 start_codon:yes stop_codon:yes gene_type:complete